MTVSSIGSGGGRDYTTIQAWEDAAPATLTSPWEGECYNDSEFSVAGTIVAFAGTTTSSTNYIELRPATGQGFKNHASASSNPLKYDQSKGVGLKCTAAYSSGIDIGIDHVKLRGLQITHTAASNPTVLGQGNSGLTGVLIADCILDKAASTSGAIATFRAGTMQNCLLIQRQSGGGDGLDLSFPDSDVTLLNNDFVRPSDITAGGTALVAANGTTTVKNCAFFGFTDVVNDNSRFTGSNNASDVAIGFGSSNQASVTYSSQFEDVVDAGGVDYRAKSGGALINNGTNSGTPSTDIIGQSISTTTRDIGAWEFQAGGSSNKAGPLVNSGSLKILAGISGALISKPCYTQTYQMRKGIWPPINELFMVSKGSPPTNRSISA